MDFENIFQVGMANETFLFLLIDNEQFYQMNILYFKAICCPVGTLMTKERDSLKLSL